MKHETIYDMTCLSQPYYKSQKSTLKVRCWLISDNAIKVKILVFFKKLYNANTLPNSILLRFVAKKLIEKQFAVSFQN